MACAGLAIAMLGGPMIAGWAQAGPVAAQARSSDIDGDGISDNADNCTVVANAAQRDTDADLYGNVCDADLNNDGIVNFADLALLKQEFFTSGDLNADLDGDGNVNFSDLAITRNQFFGAPGPSGAAASAARATLTRVFPELSFSAPVGMYQPPHSGTHWYIVEQAGVVRRLENSASASVSAGYLDITDRVQAGGEAGLLGMAFHPSFPDDGRVFVSYTAPGITTALISTISQFTSADGGATLDPDSETVILTAEQRFLNHNGGNIAFGHDGFLYIGLGDGSGSAANAQDTNTLLGAILRIDVNVPPDRLSDGIAYVIPPDNPFAANAQCFGTSGCPELYAWGLRNPWRFSFDRLTGEMWLGDVGRHTAEEIDRIVLGGNYGWRCYEGLEPYITTDCQPAEFYEPPVHTYGHDLGMSVTGGYVYRGTSIPALRGVYIYGDYRSGRIWGISNDQPLAGELVNSDIRISAFAEDLQGELYALDYLGGGVFRIDP